MKQLYLYLLLLILIILQSCSFEPKGNHFVEVNPTGTPPNIQINLNLAADTIFVPQNEKVTFAYGLDNTKINWAKFIINGQLMSDVDITSTNFEMTRTFQDWPGTTYSLEMQIFCKSQTGSMADRIGAEGYMVSRKWKVKIMTNYEMASHILKTEFVNGSLRIEWSKYKGVEFVNYKLYKFMPFTTQRLFQIATITSPNQVSFIDTTYHGERTEYYIVNNDRFQGTSVLIEGPIPVLTTENAPNGDIVLKWTKAPYYNNLSGYRVSYRDRLGTIQTLANTANGTVETFTMPGPLFAHRYEYSLNPIGKSANYYDQYNMALLTTSATAYYGVNIPNYYEALSGPDPVTYLLSSTDGILRFDHRTFSVTRKIKYPETMYQFYLSPNGKYMVTRINNPRKIYFEDLTDSTKSKSIDISVLFPQMQYVATVSNAGTGIMINNKTAVLYDYIHEQKLAEILLANSLYSNRISASGNFLYFGSSTSCEYYQYKDNQFVLLEKGSNQGTELVVNAEFLPGNNEKLVRVFHNRVEVVDCNTWTIEKKWLFSNQITTALNLDSKTGKMLLCENPKLVLLDVMNGTKEELATLDDFGYMDWSFFYNYGQLLWGQGKALK